MLLRCFYTNNILGDSKTPPRRSNNAIAPILNQPRLSNTNQIHHCIRHQNTVISIYWFISSSHILIHRAILVFVQKYQLSEEFPTYFLRIFSTKQNQNSILSSTFHSTADISTNTTPQQSTYVNSASSLPCSQYELPDLLFRAFF